MIGDVALRDGRIAFVGAHARGAARQVINARGKAVSPGFINMLSWSTESLLIDGRAQSDLRQGVTLEVMGEGESMGPLTPAMTRALIAQQEDGRHYPVTWTTLGGYLDHLAARGIAPRSEEHTSELQSLMRISYAVFCLKKKKQKDQTELICR